MKYLYQITGNPKLLYFPLKIYAAPTIHHFALLNSPVLKDRNKIKLGIVKSDAKDQIN